MKILVGICTGGSVHAQTMVSVISALDAIREYGDISYQLSIQIGGSKPRNMNRLVREMLDGGFDALMSIDADMVFPRDGIIRLIENDKDIVGGNYAVRGNGVTGNPKECVVKMADKNGKKIKTNLSALPKELFKCNSLGNGFTLYKAKVFKNKKAGWFQDREEEDGSWYGQDVQFQENAQKEGFEVWCNPKIKIGHIGYFKYEI